jgi:hypothetical protein
LDKENFSSAHYLAVDDVLVFSLFASKKHRSSYRALRPPPLCSSPREIPDDVGVNIRKICDQVINRNHPTFEQCMTASATLAHTYPNLIQQGETEIAQQ